jgi:predicted esterase
MVTRTNMESSVDFVSVFRPALDKEDVPTFLLLHGTGGNESDLLDLGRQIAPQTNLLGVRGRVLENGMPRFFRRLAEGVFDVDDLRRRTDELADFLPTAAVRYGFDPGRIIALGYSNGANIAGGLLLLCPDALAGAILLRPMVPLVPEALPDLGGVPVLITAGVRDPLISPSETERLADLLRQTGALVSQVTHPGGHGLTSADVQSAQDWFRAQEIPG